MAGSSERGDAPIDTMIVNASAETESLDLEKVIKASSQSIDDALDCGLDDFCDLMDKSFVIQTAQSQGWFRDFDFALFMNGQDGAAEEVVQDLNSHFIRLARNTLETTESRYPSPNLEGELAAMAVTYNLHVGRERRELRDWMRHSKSTSVDQSVLVADKDVFVYSVLFIAHWVYHTVWMNALVKVGRLPKSGQDENCIKAVLAVYDYLGWRWNLLKEKMMVAHGIDEHGVEIGLDGNDLVETVEGQV